MSVRRILLINQPEIGKLIRELRLENQLTQEEFAAELGTTYSSVNRWENGRSKPSRLAITRLEDLLQKMGSRGQELLAKHLAN